MKFTEDGSTSSISNFAGAVDGAAVGAVVGLAVGFGATVGFGVFVGKGLIVGKGKEGKSKALTALKSKSTKNKITSKATNLPNRIAKNIKSKKGRNENNYEAVLKSKLEQDA